MATTSTFFRVTPGDIAKLTGLSKTLVGQMRSDSLEMTVFEIGEGEVILLRRGNVGVTVDGGATMKKENVSLGEAFKDYLRQEQVKLMALVASHPHTDHLNALSTVLGFGGQVLRKNATYYDNGVKMGVNLQTTLVKALKAQRVKIVHVTPSGEQFKLGKDVTVTMYVDGAKKPRPDYRSILMSLKFRHTRFLLTGDMYRTYEKELLASPAAAVMDADVLKITHHGSADGTSREFADHVTPRISVASTGPTSDHRLEANVRARLKAFGQVYDTNTNGGDITVRTDGVWRTLAGKEGVLYEVVVRKPGVLKAHA